VGKFKGGYYYNPVVPEIPVVMVDVGTPLITGGGISSTDFL